MRRLRRDVGGLDRRRRARGRPPAGGGGRDRGRLGGGRRATRPAPAAAAARCAGLGRLAGAVAAPAAPLVAAQPGGAALRAALLRRGRGGQREIPRLREALARMPAEFDGRLGSRPSTGAAAAGCCSARRARPPASVADAVLASCAVPWIFRPVTIGGREYVDGGVWSAANLDAAPVGQGTAVLCLNPTATPRLSADRLGAVRAFAGSTAADRGARPARPRRARPDRRTRRRRVAAIGPDLFDPRRRPQVEAAGYAQGRALAA